MHGAVGPFEHAGQQFFGLLTRLGGCEHDVEIVLVDELPEFRDRLLVAEEAVEDGGRPGVAGGVPNKPATPAEALERLRRGSGD